MHAPMKEIAVLPGIKIVGVKLFSSNASFFLFFFYFFFLQGRKGIDNGIF